MIFSRLALLSVLGAGVLLSSCQGSVVHSLASSFGGRQIAADGERVEKSFDFEAIRSLRAMNAVVVHYSQDSVTSVRAEAPENVMEVAVVRMGDNGELQLELESGSKFRYRNYTDRLHVYVSAPELEGISAFSGSHIENSTPLRISGLLGLHCGSGASIELSSVYGDSITGLSTTGGNINLKDVRCAVADLSAHTGSSLDADSLICGYADLHAQTGASLSATGEAASGEVSALTGASVYASGMRIKSGRLTAYTGGHVKACVDEVSSQKAATGGSISNKAN